MDGSLTINDPIVFERDGTTYANSRDVAAFFDKRHEHVLEAIDNLLKKNNTEKSVPTSWYVERIEPRPVGNPGRPMRSFDMTKDGFTLLAMGFTGEKALTFKLAYIERFNTFESALRNRAAGFSIPQTLSEALRLAADQQEQIEKQKLKIEADKPKVDGFERISGATGLMTVTEAAKVLGVPPQACLFKWLATNKWIYRRAGSKNWLAYQSVIQVGWVEHKARTITDAETGDDRIAEQVMITPLGLTKLATVFGPPEQRITKKSRKKATAASEPELNI